MPKNKWKKCIKRGKCKKQKLLQNNRKKIIILLENQKKICKKPIEMHKNENKYLPKWCDSYVLACSITYTSRKENVLKKYIETLITKCWLILEHFFISFSFWMIWNVMGMLI
jgi:hypothetical protein